MSSQMIIEEAKNETYLDSSASFRASRASLSSLTKNRIADLAAGQGSITNLNNSADLSQEEIDKGMYGEQKSMKNISRLSNNNNYVAMDGSEHQGEVKLSLRDYHVYSNNQLISSRLALYPEEIKI